MRVSIGTIATAPANRTPGAVSWLDQWTPPNLGHLLAQDAPPGQPQPNLDPEQLPDIAHMRDTLDRALAALGKQWADLTDVQKQQLVDQIYRAAEQGHVTDLTQLTVATGASAAALATAMVAIALIASRQVVAEAAAQGVEVGTVHLPVSVFEPIAEVVAGLLGDELRVAAARGALRTGPDATPAQVAQAARQALDALSDASPQRELGGALHGSMNTARAATLRSAPVGAIYASEVNDRNTCRPCRDVNGRWLGNTDDLAQALALYPAGAYGGYIDCLGGIRCRGTIVGVWRPKQVRPGDVLAKFNPDQPRNPDGKWGAGASIVKAVMKLGDSHVTLGAHGDGRTSITDTHGNTLHLDKADVEAGRGTRNFRHFAYHGTGTEHVGDRSWMTKVTTREGKPWTVVTAGLEKTYVAKAGDPGVIDPAEPEIHDRHTLHIAPGGGVDDPEELFSQPGTTVSTKEMGHLADTLRTLSTTADRFDTGHGHVDMHVVGGSYTLDPGQRGAPAIVLSRGELRNVDKALSAAFEAYDPEEGPALPADQQFRQVVSTKGIGDITITRAGPDGDYWIESNTTAVQVAPARIYDFTTQIEEMLAGGPDLKHLSPAGGAE